MLYEATGFERYLKMAQKAAWYLSTWQCHQSVVYPSDSILGKMGYDTFGPFKLVGGIAKGHPDEDDIKNAVEFVTRL